MTASQTRGVRVLPAPLSTSSKHLLAAAALTLLTILAFGNSFDSGFVLDNRGLLLNDPRLREATAANLRLIWQHTYWWPTGEGGVYRPFSTLTYLFSYAVLGNSDRPGGYHAVNFLLHLANALMIYALANRFIRKFWAAFFIAAIWAVHPVLTEAVTNIVGRADLLAATGLLGGFSNLSQEHRNRRLASMGMARSASRVHLYWCFLKRKCGRHPGSYRRLRTDVPEGA